MIEEWEARWAEAEARREKDRRRQKQPDDLELRELYPAKAGTCKWCGEAIYRVNKAGRVVRHHSRMWHEGREVHPDAQPEPDCISEYHKQHFSFRTAVGAKDNYVCQDCGLDLAAELAAFDLEWKAFDAWSQSVYEREDAEERREWRRLYDAGEQTYRPGRVTAWDRRRERADDWHRRNGYRPAWHADHVIPLEDGGLHEVANGQVLCPGCHSRKTARENAERAARRRELVS